MTRLSLSLLEWCPLGGAAKKKRIIKNKSIGDVGWKGELWWQWGMRIIDQICLRYNGFSSYWHFDVLWHNFSHGVRSQLPQRLESTCSCTLISPRDIDALLRSFVSSMEYSLRMFERCWSLYCNGDFVALAAENSPTCAICRNYMLIHNSSPYNHEWWPIFE